MKFLVLFAISLLSLAQGQASTVTEDLVAAQADLTIGHQFSEEALVESRIRLSSYLETIESAALDAFMTAYASIKTRGIETREEMEGFTETSTCKDAVRARWELQVARYGQSLSQCLGNTLV